MKKLIYYPAGCYGTFVNWICNVNKKVEDKDLPFLDFGNSHKYYEENIDLTSKEQIDQFLNNADDHTVARKIWPYNFGTKLINHQQKPNFYFDTVYPDLESLLQNNIKILILHASHESRIWHYQNYCEKGHAYQHILNRARSVPDEDTSIDLPWLTTLDPVTRARHHLEMQLQQSHQGLDKIYQKFDKTSALDFELSELRYAMAWELQQRDPEFHEFWDQIKLLLPQIKFVEIQQLRDNFHDTILSILNWFNIHSDVVDNLDFIHQEWYQRQEHKFKDQVINSIVDSIIENRYLDWQDQSLNFFDTVYIEKILKYEHGLDLKLVNTWPTNTRDFYKIIK